MSSSTGAMPVRRASIRPNSWLARLFTTPTPSMRLFQSSSGWLVRCQTRFRVLNLKQLSRPTKALASCSTHSQNMVLPLFAICPQTSRQPSNSRVASRIRVKQFLAASGNFIQNLKITTTRPIRKLFLSRTPTAPIRTTHRARRCFVASSARARAAKVFWWMALPSPTRSANKTLRLSPLSQRQSSLVFTSSQASICEPSVLRFG